MPFKVQGGNVKDIFVTEEELIERFTGKQLWTWGLGTTGQLGNNATTSRSSPVQTISGGGDWRNAIASQRIHTVATKTDGTLWAWGDAGYGQLGNNSTTDRSSPVQTIAGGTNWRDASAGYTHTAATKTDGTLWTWGSNTSGRLGDNTIVRRSSPVQTVSGGTNWRGVSAGVGSMAATKTDGTLWLWGQGSFGRLGNNAITDRSSPVQTISGGNDWRSVSVGCRHTVATKTDGTLWAWGYGANGRLGNNAITDRSSPVQTISGGTNWRSANAGLQHNAAIKTDGTLWTWGASAAGELGDNAVASRSSPVQTISGGTNWRNVSAGANHTAAIKTDGTLWLWGYNRSGRLGTNSTTFQSSPVQTISGGNNWRTVSAGLGHTAATRLEEF